MFTIKNIAIGLGSTWAMALFLSPNAWAGIPIQHWIQPSGAKVYLVESPAIPMVDVQLDFDAGSRRDPVGQSGLASAMASLSDKGVLAQPGQAALNENALSEAWADLGAGFGATATQDRLSFALRSLTYPDLLPQAVQLAARQLSAPAFPDAIWQRERERWSAAIRQANTRPAQLAQQAFSSEVYGTHPYGADTTEATLARISTQDMRQRYAQWVQPCRAQVTVVGAVTRTQADTLVTDLLARLPGSDCSALPDVAEVAPLAKAVEKRIAFDSAQAHVLIGQPGVRRDDPDYFALTVGNYILGGGGFVSRLTHEVREKRGLTYSVYSYFSPARHAGAFTVGLQTRPDQAAQAVQVAKQVVAQFVADGPTEAELQAAKDNLIGGFALRLDSNRKLLENVANIAWNDLPLDYLDTWTQAVAKVSVTDIKQAFGKHLQPDRMVTVILGAADAAR